MLRPWTSTVTPALALSLIVACSSAGVGQQTESASSETGGGDTGTQQTTTDDSASFTDTTPTTTFESSTDPGNTTPDSGDDSTTDVTGPTNTTGDTTGVDTGSTGTGDTGSDTGTSTGPDTGDTGDTGDTSTTGSTGSSTSTGDPQDPCLDGELNGDETDVDCGGSCKGCDEGQSCGFDPDCLSLSCGPDSLCLAAACDDGKLNGSETDIDCGGDCDADCLDGDNCAVAEDCESGVCDAKICAAPACDDNAQNGDETDVDCGGSCDACIDGEACLLADDCISGVCVDELCAAPSCTDGVKNGGEAGIDCGGPLCAACLVENLVINEVDYDTVGTDNISAEFIEIYNNTGATVNLQNIALVLVNGANNTVYLTLPLSGAGSLDQGKYLLVAPAAFVAPPGVAKVNFAGTTDQIQNGAPSPDGVVLIDTVAKKVLDALSYEGELTMANIPALGGVTNLVEGTALKATIADSNVDPASLARLPNGTDTNNAATDWALSKNITPGAANKP